LTLNHLNPEEAYGCGISSSFKKVAKILLPSPNLNDVGFINYLF
jgi:hypothetical protein